MIPKPLIYLASPYSHQCENERLWRAKKASRVAGCLMRGGLLVFSPIAHSHEIVCQVPELGGDFETWRDFDTRMLLTCDALVVLQLSGWGVSKGVLAEIDIAVAAGMRVEYLDEIGIEKAYTRWGERLAGELSAGSLVVVDDPLGDGSI